MKKKDVIYQINMAALLGKSSLNEVANLAGKKYLEDYQRQALAVASTYNLCAGMLAAKLGLATLVWDKP